MSVLYNRLKNAEKEKKPEAPISEEEGFPIEGEIKRQKAEQRNRRKWGMMGGLFLFFLLIFAGAVFISYKEATRRDKPAKPSARVSPAPEKAKASPAVKKAELKIPSKKAKASPAVKKAEQATPKAKTTAKVATHIAKPKAPVKPEVRPEEAFEQATQLYKQRKYKAAANTYMEGLQDNPEYAVGYNNLGVVYYKQGKLRKSLSQLKLAVELNPRYAEAHYNLAVVLEKLGREKNALIHYLKFLELAPSGQKELQDKVQTHIRYYY